MPTIQATPIQGVALSGQPLTNPAIAPVVIGASNGLNAYNVLCDSSGRIIATGAAANSATAAGAPVQVGGVGSDGNAYALQVNKNGSAIVLHEGQKATYLATVYAYAPINNATNIIQILGSGTKLVRVNRIRISASATTAQIIDILLNKQVTADTGSTPVVVTLVPADSTDSAATAAIAKYTVTNPTAGTLVGTVRTGKLGLGSATVAPTALEFLFGKDNGRSLVLRGVTEGLAISLNTLPTVIGMLMDIEIEYTEE